MSARKEMLPDFDHSNSQDGICGHCEHNAKVRASRRAEKKKARAVLAKSTPRPEK